MSDLLTTAQAATLAGITPAAFRKAASTDPALREAKTMIDGRTPGYPRTVVEAWRESTPRRAIRAFIGLVVVVLAVVGLSGSAPASDLDPNGLALCQAHLGVKAAVIGSMGTSTSGVLAEVKNYTAARQVVTDPDLLIDSYPVVRDRCLAYGLDLDINDYLFRAP